MKVFYCSDPSFVNHFPFPPSMWWWWWMAGEDSSQAQFMAVSLFILFIFMPTISTNNSRTLCFWCVQLLCSPVIINYVASLIDTVGSDGSKFHWITADIYKAPCIPEDPKLLYKLSTAMHQPHLRDQYIFLGKCRCLWGEKGIYSMELQNTIAEEQER